MSSKRSPQTGWERHRGKQQVAQDRHGTISTADLSSDTELCCFAKYSDHAENCVLYSSADSSASGASSFTNKSSELMESGGTEVPFHDVADFPKTFCAERPARHDISMDPLRLPGSLRPLSHSPSPGDTPPSAHSSLSCSSLASAFRVPPPYGPFRGHLCARVPMSR